MKKYRIRNLLTTIALCAAMAVSPLGAAKAQAAASIAEGIDVSHYQRTIDWAKVAKSGIRFAFIRIGTSNTIDETFAQNLTGAQAVGIRTGAYYYTYATTPEQATREAQQLLDLIAPYHVNFPIAIDLEAQVQKKLTKDQLAAVGNAFLAVINQAGYFPMVYASKNWFNKRIGIVGGDRWVAQYNTSCSLDVPYGVWQYTSHGQVPGIPTRVDMDHLYQDYFTMIPQQGFIAREGITYYYDDWRWRTGMITPPQGGLYYAAETGAIQTGLLTLNEKVYYFDPAQGGKAYVGFANLPDGTRYFGEDGVMLTGQQMIGDRVYYFDANGIMKTGMMKTAEGQYYLDTDGHCVVGFVQIGDGYYYFDAYTGQMLKDMTANLDGVDTTFDSKGRVIAPEGYVPVNIQAVAPEAAVAQKAAIDAGK